MSWTSNFGKKVALVVTSAAALVASSDFATAQDITKSATPTKSAEANKSDAAIFAKYDKLDAPETRTRHKEFLSNAATKKALEQASAAMAGKKVDDSALARAVTSLVAGRVEEDAAVSMDAVMRHYYTTSLSARNLKANKAEANLEKRARALDDAVFGKPPVKNRSIRARRAARRARR